MPTPAHSPQASQLRAIQTAAACWSPEASCSSRRMARTRRARHRRVAEPEGFCVMMSAAIAVRTIRSLAGSDVTVGATVKTDIAGPQAGIPSPEGNTRIGRGARYNLYFRVNGRTPLGTHSVGSENVQGWVLGRQMLSARDALDHGEQRRSSLRNIPSQAKANDRYCGQGGLP